MLFYRTQPLRIISGATLLLFLIGLPLVLGLTRPSTGQVEAPGIVVAYAMGLTSLSIAGLVALVFAVIFSVWLIAGRREEIHRKYLGKSARRHHNTVATLRLLAITIGAAGLIVGTLAGLYGAMIQARPETYNQLPLPFLTVELALIGLIGGGILYALGRVGANGRTLP
ncbi:MAG: hypothetical protein EON93_13615 [Burkholderiales bacterium]|nr:MAG: hypothetical protein EON93_13615 [Burkholderiales bacterium]